MRFFNYFWQANWAELYAFMSRGNPPLFVVLIAINTTFLVYFMVRRMRGARTLRPETAAAIQGIIIAANMFMLFYAEIMSTFQSIRY